MSNHFYINPAHSKFVPENSSLKIDDVGQLENPGAWLFMCALCAGITLSIGLTMFAFAAGEDDFWNHAAKTTATVVNCDYIPAASKSEAHLRVEYRYEVFNIAGAHQYEGVDRIYNQTQCERLLENPAIYVAFHRDRLGESRIINGTTLPISSSPTLVDFLWPSSCLLILLIPLAVMAVISAVHNDRLRHKFKRIKNKIRVFDGEIIRTRLQHFTGKSRPTEYYLIVHYRFTSPDGKEIRGKQRRRRDDLFKRPLPKPETPIKILYAADDCHIML